MIPRGTIYLAPTLAIAALLSSSSANAAPLTTTDQNPLLGGLSLNAPARIEPERGLAADLSLNWSSTALIQQSGNETLTIDAETREWRIKIERSFGNTFSARIQIPYRTTDGGSLDGVIEGWHDFFGLPNGARTDLPKNRLRLEYRQGAASILNVRDQSMAGLGDIQFELGKQLRSNESSATSLWSGISVPTGDPDELTGTGGFAGYVVLAHTQRLGKFDVFGHLGARASNADEPLEAQRRTASWMAMVGAEYRATQNASLMLQVDAHGAAFDDHGLRFLGPAYILSVGGQYAFPSAWTLQLGFGEDIKVEASPDISFLINLRKKW